MGYNFGTDLARWNPHAGDFNGDGKDDFILMGPTYALLFLSNGHGQFQERLVPYPENYNFGDHHTCKVGDWNDDGKADFIRIGPKYAHYFMSKGDGSFTAGTTHYPANSNFGDDLNYWKPMV